MENFNFLLSRYVVTYNNSEFHAAHDAGMLYNFVINSPSPESFVKIYDRSQDYHVDDYEIGIFLIKVILDESDFQTYATVMKEKAVHANIP